MYLNLIFSSFFPTRSLKLIFFFLMAAGSFFCTGCFFIMSYIRTPNSGKLPVGISDKELRIMDLDVLQLSNQRRDFPYESVIEGIRLKGIKFLRNNGQPQALIHLKRANKDIEIKDRVPLSVYFDELGCMQLDTADIQSPIKLIPFIYKNEVTVSLVDNFDRKKEKIELDPIEFRLNPQPDLQIINYLKEQIAGLSIKCPDLFISNYSDENCRIELNLGNEKIFLKDGEVIGFKDKKFFSEIHQGMMSLNLKRISAQKTTIECTDESGYFTYSFSQEAKPKEKGSIPKIEEPKQVFIRGADQISCTFQGKKQTLKKGDFFYLEMSKWKKILSLEEFNLLIDYKIQSEIFVVEDIYVQNRVVFLSGKVFDKSRWNFSNINWKFDLNKKKNTKDSAGKKAVSVPQEETTEHSDINNE